MRHRMNRRCARALAAWLSALEAGAGQIVAEPLNRAEVTLETRENLDRLRRKAEEAVAEMTPAMPKMETVQ